MEGPLKSFSADEDEDDDEEGKLTELMDTSP